MAGEQSKIENQKSKIHFLLPIVAGIGNALMAVPLVRQIKRNFPASTITILARIGPMGEPFRRLNEVDEVVITGKGLKGLLKLVHESRSRRPDVYMVPFPSNRWEYSMLALTSGAKRKLLHRYPVGRFKALGFIGERVVALRGIHDVEQNLRLLNPLDTSIDPNEAPVFPLTDGDRARANGLIEAIGLTPRSPYIAIHAGSAKTILAQAKRWGADNYARLISRLLELFQHDVVILEGPDETGVAEEVLSAGSIHRPCDRVHALKLTGPLGEAGAILERARLYVGTDSGLAHLAASVGTRAVTIFAPADPSRVCPFGQRELVVKPDKACSPCFLYPWEKTKPAMRCCEPFCIREVTVDAVLEKVQMALTSAPLYTGERGAAR